MRQDGIDARDLGRAVLRLRLAAIALGVTLLILSPRSDQTAAAAALLGYAAAVVILRFAPVRMPALPALAVAIDVLFAAGLSFLLPLSAGTWALYALAIGCAALAFGAIGAAAATAAAIVAYDVVIVLRADELRPSDLWPVQLLLAIGLLVAELVWAVTRGDASRRRLRAFGLAQRDLIAARDEDELLDRLADHAIRSFDATSAWVESGPASPVRHQRGLALPEDRAPSVLAPSWPLAPDASLRCAFDDATAAAAGGPVVRDLVTDAAPLLVAHRERAALAHAKATLVRTLNGVRALERDRAAAAALAEVLAAATEIAGAAAIARPADGTIIAGDLPQPTAVTLLRDTNPPALVAGGAVVAAGPGQVLVAAGTRRLTADDLHALTVLGEIAAAATARIAERDALIARGETLDRQVAELNDQLRAKDDAVASAVHELRTPLTSMHAYAQLTSRNLQSVQQQVKQLDRIISDLLRSPGPGGLGLQLADVDLLAEAKQAARRVALVSRRTVNVQAVGDGPFLLRADRSRIEQVIQNLLSNAVKFSAEVTEVELEVDRGEPDVVLAVPDHRAGSPADELDRIFERYYRGSNQRAVVAGEGIGLAVAREIVAAHGGRIWAASEGPGRGSTVFVALPIVPPEAAPLESAGGAGSRDEAARQA